MRLAPLIGCAFAVGLVVVACADSDSDTTPVALDAGAKSDAKSSSSSGGSACEKKTCESVEGACGEHDNGCGGTFNCGPCEDKADACAPLTCAQLNKTCGTFDNGCNGTVNCGACDTDCPKDGKEPNDKSEGATDLGTASDYENASITVTEQQSSDGDEDWFKLKIKDEGFGGNPLISASVTDTALEVTIFHVCDSKPDYSYCEGAGTPEATVGKGCYALGSVKLNTDCKGLDEAGTAYVRVRKRGTNKTCHAYDLTIKVE